MISTSSLKHAEGFETPILSLSSHMLQSFRSYKIHYKDSADDFGGTGLTRENPTKMTRPDNHIPVKESHGKSKFVALHA